jgi:HAMP domain-containing protein
MDTEGKETGPGGIERRVGVGIRLKLFGFLLPLVILLIVTVTLVVTEVTKSTLRRDLLQRGAAISRVVALSAGHSLLSNDPLGLDRLVSETRESDPDIVFVSIRDGSDTVVAHDRVTERGKPYRPVPPLLPLGTFGDTRADEVVRDGRRLIEYTTPISFAGRRVGIASLGLSMEGLAAAQQSIRQRIFVAAAIILVAAFFGTLLLSSFITTPVKRLHQGVLALASSETFHPVPARSTDELGALTRNFNRMAETILAQKTSLEKKAHQLEEAYVSMVRVIAASLDARDPYTMGHSTRVARMSCALGKRLGMGEEELSNLERAAIFHDLGKIQTPRRRSPQGRAPVARRGSADEKPSRRRDGDPSDGAVPAPLYSRGARPPRVVQRGGVPGRNQGGRDPAPRPAYRPGGRLRCDDHRPAVPAGPIAR